MQCNNYKFDNDNLMFYYYEFDIARSKKHNKEKYSEICKLNTKYMLIYNNINRKLILFKLFWDIKIIDN